MIINRILLIAAVGIFCICLPILVWKGEIHIDHFMTIFSTIISWPVAIVIVVILFIRRFHDALDHFLRNVSSIKGPGGFAVQKQTEENVDKLGPNREGAFLLFEQQGQIQQIIKELTEESELNATQREEVQKQLENMISMASHWKFQYLNLFFIHSTKQVLLWFANVQTQTKEIYNQSWQSVIGDAKQREIILDVLTYNGMLESAGINLTITQHGYDFLTHIGFIPSHPVAP